ncbi:MAG: hypothetical protein QHJ73_11485, partial [Armatimonadota bacterium]|nr:hypothetical protein [Armatimonadota bacterium]
PGWGRPVGECDPAFRSIRAGMGGVPILYRFTVPPNSAARVALGFCESHWAEAGQRRLVCRVEGAAPQELDPVARWGQHRPGVLLFDARDENGDGRLEVGVLPHLSSPDQNPILNAIWIFPPGSKLNVAELVAGRLGSLALLAVDVGGKGDQTLFLPGKLEYEVALPAGGSQEITFLVACPGATVPSRPGTAWNLEALRRAAVEVWNAALKPTVRLGVPDGAVMARYRAALARLLLCRHQAGGFMLPLPEPGSPERCDARAFQELVGALDLAGLGDDAERCLRVLWDAPLPAPYARFARGASGWPGDLECQAHLALSLGRHAALGADPAWVQRVLAATRPALETLAAARASGKDEALYRQALGMWARLGLADAVAAPGAASPAPPWLGALVAGLPKEGETLPAPANPTARAIWEVRHALLREEGDTLLLLPGVTEMWLGGTGLFAEGLPTFFGRVSLSAVRTADRLEVRAILPEKLAPGQAQLCLPVLGGKAPRLATVRGQAVAVLGERIPLPASGGRPVEVSVTY